MEKELVQCESKLKALDTVYLIETSQLTVHKSNRDIYSDSVDLMFDEDIKANGIRTPLVINSKNEIVDGSRRYARAVKYGISKVPVIIRNYEDEELAVVMLNKYRQKTPRELFLESKILEKKFKSYFIKKDRPMSESGIKLTGFPQVRDKVADEIGVSSFKLQQLKKIYENESKAPSIVKALDDGTITVNKASQAISLVVEEGQPEDKVLKEVLKSDIITPKVKKQRAKPIPKEYIVRCPVCNNILLSNQPVTLKPTRAPKHVTTERT